MHTTLQHIQSPIAREMERFEERFGTYMKSSNFFLNRITNYLVKRKGKQVRPMFVFLVAGACGGITDATHRGAALIELLHTATLVHDDVVDDSLYRRGFFSINALWKNKVAVLVGDYLLSRGLLLAVENRDFHLLEIVSRAVKEMSEGELLQIAKARDLDITEEVYFEIIRQKTASLIASCCAVGAASVEKPDEATIEQMYSLGETVGIAFQMKDDLFDYGTEDVGKPLGIDIKEKKMTLPLIYALSKASGQERTRIRRIIKNESHKKEKVQEVIDFVHRMGGIDYARHRMNDYYEEALRRLDILPDTPYKEALAGLIHFVIKRKS
ncbi:octaprenyl-diphosphate synthase [Thermonema lapsum]|uniref:Octaprenyl-diphosphate synthase n=1 Tax=Thermonema lapsum TaxID=28195 RepID=A0A846MSH9_9BACT|nr:polyprenyl synthetase family protein [Thermonema lapsum]NIK74207.1 octaprenyl-diphosphate synthase [Thermonema lapsum]